MTGNAIFSGALYSNPNYFELGLDPEAPLAPPSRKPFDPEACALVEEFKPEVVSFHFGLPPQHLLDRVLARESVGRTESSLPLGGAK